MPCNEYLDLISAHIDNEISEADECRLQAHLAECEDCRALLEAFSHADSGLASLTVEAPEGLKDSVMKNLPKQAKKERHFGRYFGIGLAAAAAIALAIGFSSKLPSLNTKKETAREFPAQQIAETSQEACEIPFLTSQIDATLPPAEADDISEASLFAAETTEDDAGGSTKRHSGHSLDATAQTVAVLENIDGRELPELDGLEPTACFSNADDLPELPISLPEVFADGLCFVKVYELDRENFLSIIEAYEGVLPLTYDDSFKSPSVCLYVLTPAGE